MSNIPEESKERLEPPIDAYQEMIKHKQAEKKRNTHMLQKKEYVDNLIQEFRESKRNEQHTKAVETYISNEVLQHNVAYPRKTASYYKHNIWWLSLILLLTLLICTQIVLLYYGKPKKNEKTFIYIVRWYQLTILFVLQFFISSEYIKLAIIQLCLVFNAVMYMNLLGSFRNKIETFVQICLLIFAIILLLTHIYPSYIWQI